MSANEFFQQFDQLSKQASERFLSGIKQSNTHLYRRVIAIIKDLNITSDGRIKTTKANLSKLLRSQQELEKAILTDTYQARTAQFLASFASIKKLADLYLLGLISFDVNKPLYQFIVEDSIRLTQNSLLSSGISQGVSKPIYQLLQQNVTSGGFFDELVESLRIQIQGNESRLGVLERYSKQITADALNQFNANYTQAFTKDLKLDWFLYRGGIRSTTRDYCRRRANKYWHRSEIEKSTSRSWNGKATGTNSNTIFVKRGGYGCRHQYIPVLDNAVPKRYIEAFEKKVAVRK